MTREEIQGEIIPSITQKIVAAYKPEKIILFGSYAYGNPDDDSDIDLLIIKETSESSMERWLAIHDILREYKYISISPLVYTPDEFKSRMDLNDFFISKIIRRGKVLYG